MSEPPPDDLDRRGLRDSEEKYRSLFEAMSQGYGECEIIRDAANRAIDYRVLEMNPAFERLVGVAAAEARGRPAQQVIPGLESWWVETFDEVVKTGRSRRVEREVPQIGRWCEVHAYALGGDRFAVLFDDITQRKHAEEALRASEEGLRMALDAGRMGTYRFDVTSGAEQWNDNQYALLGLERTAEPPSRELFLSVVHPDDRHLVAFTADDQRPAGTSLDSEFRIIRPDTGEVRILTAHALARFGADGRPAELVGINQDVTEERRIQSALRATEERMQQFGEASSDVLWIRDARSLQWDYLSPAFERIYGLSRQDALKADNFHTWLGMIVPEDREGSRAAIERVARGERAAFEYRIRRPDGGTRWLRDTDFPIRDQSGTVTHIAGVGSDITAAKQAAEHQRLLLHELQHRVRNTLAVIRSIVRRTARTSSDKDDFQMHLEGRIQAFARVQAAVTRDPTTGVDLAFLVAEELRTLGAIEEQNLTLRGPPVALSAKAAETIGLAIHELATNAVKYGALSSPRGRIDVAWDILPDGAEQRLRFEWSERGVAEMPPEPRRTGFGTEILERTLAYDIKAATTLDFRPDGLRCVITVPMAQLQAGPMWPADRPAGAPL